MIEWFAFVITIIAVFCNSFMIIPWNYLFGVVSAILWCIYASDENLPAVFWINFIIGTIYLMGYMEYLLVT
jgi:hypothetical protein